MKKVVIAWGRLNPPTIGHEQLVRKVQDVARRERAEPRIYLSHSQSAKKDPLQYRDKVAMAKKAFGDVIKVSQSRTLIQLMQELQKAGFTEVTMVAGSDRVPEYDTLLNKYNGKDYSFDSIKVVSAGQRDPDAEGVSGMSASKMRAAASSGDMNAFMQGVPSKLSKADAMKLYTMVRKGLLIEEMELYLKTLKEYTDADFSDQDLEEAVINIDLDELDELDEDEDELVERAPLTIQQRIKKARIMKRLAPRLKRQRQIKKFRMAPAERLQQRARKMARNLLRKKYAGEKGAQYSTLPMSQRITIDKLIDKKTPVIDRMVKRLMPIIRKKEVERIRQARRGTQEGVERFDAGFEALIERTSTRQDPDIKDREGTQPARYHSGLAKSTKAARDAQFKKQTKMDSDDPRAYKPAPGDKEAETRPSKHTKKYKELFGEAGPGVQRARQAIEREKQADKREKQRDKVRHDRLLDRARTLDTIRKNKASNPYSGTEEFELSEKSLDALKKKASKSGYSYGTLKKVYDRGVAAWRTGHRPGTTPQQWGYARVNAFIAKQKSGQKLDHDKDLANEYIPEEVKGKQLVHHGEETKHFDICPKALKAFDQNQKDGMGDKEGFHDAVVAVDRYLGLEKRLMDKEDVTNTDMQRMEALVSNAKKKIAAAGLPGHDYHQMHIDAVKDMMDGKEETNESKGLWHNIHKKRREGRPMREPYSKGAPTKQDFERAQSEGYAKSRAQQAAIAIAKKEKGEYKEEAPVIDGKKMHRLGSKPGSYKELVKRHLGAGAAEKIDKSDGNKLVAKGKRTGNQELVRKGSFIKNVIAKEETQLDESLQIEKGAGVGTFMTAADLGMKFKGAFQYHPSIEEEGGAGEEGTDKLAKKYKKDTPGQ